MPVTPGVPLISDFGAARMGDPGQRHSGDVMPAPYRAPEVILGMEWNNKIDIWSFGCMVGYKTFCSYFSTSEAKQESRFGIFSKEEFCFDRTKMEH